MDADKPMELHVNRFTDMLSGGSMEDSAKGRGSGSRT